MTAPNVEDFQAALDKIFALAEEQGLTAVAVKSGNLHRLVGDYPRRNHRMPLCCHVMRKNMSYDDEILNKPPRGKGASLVILYKMPRLKMF